MLDVNHPQSRFIFDASAVQSDMFKILDMIEKGHESVVDLGELSEPYIKELECLNERADFSYSDEIQVTLNKVRELLNTFTDIEEIRWALYHLLEEGGTPNFGTWAI